jgi:hypothetical protein
MPRSNLDLFNRALSLIGAKAAGQPASAEDIEFAKQTMQSLAAELNAINAAYVHVNTRDIAVAEIEDALFLPLAEILANEMAPDFGLPRASGADREVLINRLRKVIALDATYQHQEAEYF